MMMREYIPQHSENRMQLEGDLKTARRRFFNDRPNNLIFLLRQRYEWMNDYVSQKENVYELGAGAGFSKEFIENERLVLTDISGEDWIGKHVDALNLPFSQNSIDVLICSHMIHHLACPLNFFDRAYQVLKPGGMILISEINTSFLMRFILRIMRHEGWSYDINVFDRTKISNDPSDPWSANCAIPQILFENSARFESALPGLKIIRNELTECFIFPLSGGVIAKSKTITLPNAGLNIINKLDQALISLFPKFFALGRRVVIQKT